MNYFDWIFRNVSTFRELEDDIKNGKLPAVVSGPAAIHKAHIAAALSGQLPAILLIAADEAEASQMLSDLEMMGVSCRYFPLRDFSFFPLEGISREYEHARVQAMCALLDGTTKVVVTVADAAVQFTLPPEQLAQRRVTLRPGAEYPVEQITAALAAGGYERTDCVEGAGQFSVRGGIVDIFPPANDLPVRVELFGDEVDTIFSFDPVTQRRTDPVEVVDIFPASELSVSDPAELAEKLRGLAKSLRGVGAPIIREKLSAEADRLSAGVIPPSCDKYLPLICERQATIFDYLPENSLVIVSEHTLTAERVHNACERLQEEVKELMEDGALCRGLTEFALTEEQYTAKIAGRTVFLDTFAHGSFTFPLGSLRNVDARPVPPWDGTVASLLEDLGPLLQTKYAVAICAGTAKAADSLCDELCASGIDAVRADCPEMLVSGKVAVTTGSLSTGFDYPTARAAVITWGAMLGYAKSKQQKKRRARFKKGAELQSLSELNVGDYIVHITYGIGVFCGIEKVTTGGVTRDYITIAYARGDSLQVPVTQLDMVGKYIGAKEDGKVKINTMGGGDWQRQKARVRKAVRDIAQQLIKLYAERMKAEGYPFDPDTDYQRDFETRFPYDETEDQLRSIGEIKRDMERPVPMDRLLCGDVGFGKTEVALRAAFKCMVEGRQCALLAPTTILAWQHYQTALQRFEGFPFRIELLSRFRTPKQQAHTTEALKKGEVDLLIGTHRMIQKDVEFRDLGLAIIDEEQRFGVAHKERFKEMFRSVDQLTLSATPIPRTLNMALSGLRDISSLDEAPTNRQPVQTFVMEYNPAIIADAIRRELRRGGQVYYLHNRVGDIESVAMKLQAMVPEAVIGVAHGQMTEQQISKEWKKLVDRETDILLCTTIIESGVDVSNANTLIVEDADRFGLSQLHQLRGRVGRSNRRAYAYFTFRPGREMTEIASKRLQAIREFTEFGSGMKIAMRDLELRGAGEILGAEQSGHLESVGYDLYMKMLNEAVAEEKGEKVQSIETQCTIDLPVDAYIPESYIESTTVRLDAYRMIADIRSKEDSSEVIDELIDRFGDPPKPVMGLITVALTRNLAMSLGISDVRQRDGRMIFFFAGDALEYERIAKLAQTLKGRVLLSAGSKPYMSVKCDKSLPLIDDLAEILREYAKTAEPAKPAQA